MQFFIKQDDILNILKNSLSKYDLSIFETNNFYSLSLNEDENIKLIANANNFYKNYIDSRSVKIIDLKIIEKDNQIIVVDSDFQLLVDYITVLYNNVDVYYLIDEKNLDLLRKYKIKFIENDEAGVVINLFPQEKQYIINPMSMNDINENLTIESELEKIFLLLEKNFKVNSTNQVNMNTSIVLNEENYLKNKLSELTEVECIDLLKNFGFLFYIIYFQVYSLNNNITIKNSTDKEEINELIKNKQLWKNNLSSMGKYISDNDYMDLKNSKNPGKKYYFHMIILQNCEELYYLTNNFYNIFKYLDLLREEEFIDSVIKNINIDNRLNYVCSDTSRFKGALYQNIAIYLFKYLKDGNKTLPLPKIQNVLKAFFFNDISILYNLNEIINYKEELKIRDNFLLHFFDIKNEKLMKYLKKKIYEKNDGFLKANILLFTFKYQNNEEDIDPLLNVLVDNNMIKYMCKNEILSKISIDYLINFMSTKKSLLFDTLLVKYLFNSCDTLEIYHKNKKTILDCVKIIIESGKKKLDESYYQRMLFDYCFHLSGFVRTKGILINKWEKFTELNDELIDAYLNYVKGFKYYSITLGENVDENFCGNNEIILENKTLIKDVLSKIDYVRVITFIEGKNSYTSYEGMVNKNMSVSEHSIYSLFKNQYMKVFSYKEILEIKGSIFPISVLKNDENFNDYIIRNYKEVKNMLENNAFDNDSELFKLKILHKNLYKIMIDDSINPNLDWLKQENRYVSLIKNIGADAAK